MENLIENTRFIIVCLSLKSLKSYTQSIETNKLLDYSFKDNNKVIYLITDPNYEPLLLNSIKNNNNYFPYYDQETVNDSFEKIIKKIHS